MNNASKLTSDPSTLLERQSPPDAPRKRRSRWGDEKPAGVNPAMPTAIMGSNVSQLELEQYANRMRVEEINIKLRTNDVVPPERQR
jgi:splicing factor 1